MTEDEHIKLVDIGDQFWIDFSILAAKYIAMMPEDIEDEVVPYLQDLCSIYGSRAFDILAAMRGVVRD
jgi:hypothetical protein